MKAKEYQEQPTSRPRKAPGSKLNALTSLRLIAALMVVIHHARGILLPVELTVPAIEAVSFFFVLSGFILTYSYHQRQYTLREFYVARLARIMPATVLSIAVFMLLNQQAPNLANPREMAITISNLLMVQAWIPISSYYFALNAVAWSVSVELGFYLLFPLLHRGLRRKSGQIMIIVVPLVIAALLFLISLWNNLPFDTRPDQNQATWVGLAYINPLARLKEFCAGILAAAVYIKLKERNSWILKSRWLLSVAEIILIGVLTIGFLNVSVPITKHPTLTSMFWYQIVIGILFGAVVTVFAAGEGLIAKALNQRWLLIGGEVSFSIYLFHQILIMWQNKNPWLLNWAPVQARFMLLLLIILVVSFTVWRWFERPMRTVIQRLLVTAPRMRDPADITDRGIHRSYGCRDRYHAVQGDRHDSHL